MIVRNAEFSDMAAMMPLAKEAHKNSMFVDFGFNEAAVQRNFVVAIQFDDGYAKVVERDNSVVGGMVGFVSENHFGVRCATDLFTFSHGGTDKLIKDFRDWARTRGAEFIQITDLSGRARYQKLVASLGLQPSGINFLGVT